jgi:hypothetical protein
MECGCKATVSCNWLAEVLLYMVHAYAGKASTALD